MIFRTCVVGEVCSPFHQSQQLEAVGKDRVRRGNVADGAFSFDSIYIVVRDSVPV